VGKEEIPLRPLAVLLGVAFGSAVALFVGLVLTAIVLLALPEFADRFAGEWRPLLFGIAWTSVLTAIAGASFVGELRARPWRRPFQWVLAAAIGGLVWIYWP
jgi:hypothetical protein